MVATSAVQEFSAAREALSEMARNDLRSLTLSEFNNVRPGIVTDLGELYGEVLEVYSSADAALAADWYDRQRELSGARTRFRTEVVGHGVATEALLDHVGYAVRGAVTMGPLKGVERLSGDLDKSIKQAGRNTGVHNANREQVGWARVPTGSDPCAFCLTLASRGAAYSTRATAGGDGNQYHGNCSCVQMRISSNSDYPDNFDPEEMYLIYREAYNTAEDKRGGKSAPSINDVVYELRRQRPDMVRDGVVTN